MLIKQQHEKKQLLEKNNGKTKVCLDESTTIKKNL